MKDRDRHFLTGACPCLQEDKEKVPVCRSKRRSDDRPANGRMRWKVESRDFKNASGK